MHCLRHKTAAGGRKKGNKIKVRYFFRTSRVQSSSKG